jgi:drug/metabolite transporter (DMT)-like permease
VIGSAIVRALFLLQDNRMVVFLSVAATMLAFAGNSVLTRLALAEMAIDAGSFALLRLASGAVILLALTAQQNRLKDLQGPNRVGGMLALSLYMIGFSYAYTKLDTGAGALVLFGVVQIAMFGAAVFAKERLPRHRVLGALIAFAGLCYLLWPQGGQPMDPVAVMAMVLAGLGWGGYSVIGRTAGPALPATAASFALALPLFGLFLWFFPLVSEPLFTPFGVLLAVLSGALTSALGYALWYRVLPQITASVAGVAQLVVPVLAMMGGMVLLDEVLTLNFILACALVLGGIATALGPHQAVLRWWLFKLSRS